MANRLSDIDNWLVNNDEYQQVVNVLEADDSRNDGHRPSLAVQVARREALYEQWLPIAIAAVIAKKEN